MGHAGLGIAASVAVFMALSAHAGIPEVPNGLTEEQVASAATLPIHGGGIQAAHRVLGRVLANAPLDPETRPFPGAPDPVSTADAIASMRLKAVGMGASAITHVQCKSFPFSMGGKIVIQCWGDAVQSDPTAGTPSQ